MNYIYQDNLETSRLKTRYLTREDIPLWAKFFECEECVQFFPTFGQTTHEGRATHWIEKQLGRYKDNRFGLQALILKETGEFIGQCGLLAQDVDGITEVEVGYHIFKQHWGKGYATEAAQLFKNFAFDNNITNSVVSIIHIDNILSQNVAERNGMKRDKLINFFDTEHYLYRIYK